MSVYIIDASFYTNYLTPYLELIGGNNVEPREENKEWWLLGNHSELSERREQNQNAYQICMENEKEIIIWQDWIIWCSIVWPQLVLVEEGEDVIFLSQRNKIAQKARANELLEP